MLNCIGFPHATRKGFNFDVDFVIHGAKQAFNFDVNDGGGCFVAVWRKEPHSVLFPSRHAPRKIRICEEQGSKGRLDSSPCQVVLAQYPWGLKSHDPFAWNIVLLLILCRWIHNCIHVSEIWQPICLKNCGVVVLAHTSQMDSELYPCFWNLTTHFLGTLCCCCHCWYFADGSRIVSMFCRLNPQLYPGAWNLTTLLLETFCCCCCW